MSDAELVYRCCVELAERPMQREQFSKEHGLNIDAVDEDGYTALMLAVIRHSSHQNNIVFQLLGTGADCDFESKNGEAALFMAMEDGYPYLVYQMLLLADKNFIASNGNSSFAVAKSFTSNMTQIIPLMEAWGFLDTD